MFRYWVMVQLLQLMPEKDGGGSSFLRSLTVLILLFFAHVLEILYFAAGLYYSSTLLKLGSLGNMIGNNFMDYFYHSAVTYSSLGMSELPSGHLRFMTALESLTGIIILTWSATFFYGVIGQNTKDCPRN
jgi:hypothetical protein